MSSDGRLGRTREVTLSVPFAHRGLHDLAAGVPENSLPAFAAAVEAGVGIELDVHATVDGRLAVVHDHDLTRVAGRPLDVRKANAEELAAIRLLGTEEALPHLETVLDLVAGRVPVMVEVKNLGAVVGRGERLVAEALRGYDGPLCVASFNPRTLLWFKEHAPDVIRGQTSGTFEHTPMPPGLRPALRRLAWNGRIEPDFVSYELAGLPHPAASRFRGSGRPLIAWGVDGEGWERAAALVDNVIFDGPVRDWASADQRSSSERKRDSDAS